MNNAYEQFAVDVKNSMDKRYSVLKDHKIAIWGIGNYGELLYQEFCNLGMRDNILCFCDDRDEVNHQLFHEIPIFNPHEVWERNDKVIFVLASSYWHIILKNIPSEIKNRICIFDVPMGDRELEVAYGTKKRNEKNQPLIFLPEWFDVYEKIDRDGTLVKMRDEVYELLIDKESKDVLENRLLFFTTGKTQYIKRIKKHPTPYFSIDYYGNTKWDNSEVLLDCGAYEAENTEDFIAFLHKIHGGYKTIHLFEPDEINCKKCKERIQSSGWHNAFIHQSAIGEQNGEMSFLNDGTGASMLSGTGEKKIKIETIDNYFDQKPTIIKMDIEGAEIEALRGAEMTIKKHKPRIAISIYHKMFDFYDVPMFLHELVPEYKFRIRHHTEYLYDTVLYACV